MRAHDEESSIDRRATPKDKVADAPRFNLDTRTMSPVAVMQLQRMAGNSAVTGLLENADPAEHVRSAIRSDAGLPLPETLRQQMEPALGSDFSSVRVHTGQTAQRSAEALGARAYTTGDHVVFGSGAYSPDSSAGQHTLAHELTHVVQQRTGPVAGTSVGGVSLSDPSDSFERAAEANADRVLAAAPVQRVAVDEEDREG